MRIKQSHSVVTDRCFSSIPVTEHVSQDRARDYTKETWCSNPIDFSIYSFENGFQFNSEGIRTEMDCNNTVSGISRKCLISVLKGTQNSDKNRSSMTSTITSLFDVSTNFEGNVYRHEVVEHHKSRSTLSSRKALFIASSTDSTKIVHCSLFFLICSPTMKTRHQQQKTSSISRMNGNYEKTRNQTTRTNFWSRIPWLLLLCHTNKTMSSRTKF